MTDAPPDHDHDPYQDRSGASVTHLNPPPQDTAAERYIIGAALQSPDILTACATIVNATSFYEPKHETLWNLMLELRAADQPTEPVAVLAALREHGHLKKIPGTYVHTLIQEATNPLYGTHYARQVEQLAKRRTAIHALEAARLRLDNPSSGADTHGELANAADALQITLEAIANPNPTTSWSPANIDAALDGRSLDPPPDMLARTDGQHLFYSGAVHTVSGPSESAKTWICLMAAVQLMTAALDVVFIDFEDRAERVIGRLLALGADKDMIRKHFHYVRPDRPIDPLSQSELAPHLTTAVLVIIDGVTEAMTMHGLDLNSNQDAATFSALLPRWAADQGPGVAMIDHVVKDVEKHDRHAIGAQHKLAAIDGAAFMVKVVRPFGRGLKGTAKITVAKDRPGHIREHARGNHIADFTLDDTTPGGLIATLDPPGHDRPEGLPEDRWVPDVLMEKISDYLARVVLPQSTNNIMDGVGGKEKHKRMALAELVQGGYITLTAGARNANMYTHTKPFPDIKPDDNPPPTQPTLED